MKTFLLSAALLVSPLIAHAEAKPWFRSAGDYMAHRTERWGVPTDPNTKILTDGTRFDTALGKRISLLTWGDEEFHKAWSFGIDGGMLASLRKESRNGSLVFATHTFDGFFGAYVSYLNNGWLAMFRTAHLSAHLVDNAPEIGDSVSYSQFWNEFVVGKTFPAPEVVSHWEVHLQGSVGLNNTSTPKGRQPRAALGISGAYALNHNGKLSVLVSGDALRAGVEGQKNSYAMFLGLGSLNRPGSTIRPYRVGISHLAGSDYRNQYYQRKQSFTSLEASTEF
ncbi:MAG: hypothetical protein EOP11_04745 [Proteobacteria bacterium]|nr:MAG: hypothetical protein EOP11_04745 [Pseudomonadota bacterium]